MIRPSTLGDSTPDSARNDLTRTPRQLRRHTLWIALVVVGALVLAACGGDDGADGTAGEIADDSGDAGDGTDETADEPSDAPTGDDVLTIRLVTDMSNLDPAWMTGTYDDAIAMNIMEGLVAFEPGTNELVNVLAETFESSDDGLRHDFTLKEGIQFHGGYGELTAEDVKFSFERIAGLTDPPLESTYEGDWTGLQEVEVTGTYSGTIIMSEPSAPLKVIALPGNAGLVVSKAAVEELGEDFATQPIGTGPYEFTSWSPGSEVVLTKFEDYGGALEGYADPPQWSQIVFRPIEDDSAAGIALETGEVDFGQIAASAVDRFEADDRFVVDPLTTFDYGWIGMNVADETLADVNLRRAIRAALDIDSMITAGFEDRVTPAHTLVSPEMPVGSWDDAPVYERDVDAALGYLEEAGISDLTLSMATTEQAGSRTIVEIAQANLAEIGITLDIEVLDGSQFREEALDGQLQLFYTSFSNGPDPSWATVWFTCEQVGDWNYMNWCNEEFDELHEAAILELDPDARNDMYVRMQEIMDEEAIAAWVMYRTNFYTFSPDLQISLVPDRYGNYAAWDFRR
ncbi:ABC transporter substrate-binding protein [soil metagenome]